MGTGTPEKTTLELVGWQFKPHDISLTYQEEGQRLSSITLSLNQSIMPNCIFMDIPIKPWTVNLWRFLAGEHSDVLGDDTP